MRNYRIASVLMIIQGAVMEIGGILFLALILIFGGPDLEMNMDYSFIVPYFAENLYLMMPMSIIFGVVRIIGAVGLWRNRMWGLVLSVINCVVTMVLMLFMLPAGIADGLLSCTALILILVQYYGTRKIIEG